MRLFIIAMSLVISSLASAGTTIPMVHPVGDSKDCGAGKLSPGRQGNIMWNVTKASGQDEQRVRSRGTKGKL